MDLIFGIMFLLFLIPTSYYFYHFAAPYAGLSEERIKNVLELAGDMKGKKVVDLGSGDGRVVIAFAKKGAEAHGYEINPLLVWRSRRTIIRAGLQDHAIIHWRSFWSADFRQYDLIHCFCINFMMGRLERKLKKEFSKKGRIISVYFEFPHLKQNDQKGDVRSYEVSR